MLTEVIFETINLMHALVQPAIVLVFGVSAMPEEDKKKPHGWMAPIDVFHHAARHMPMIVNSQEDVQARPRCDLPAGVKLDHAAIAVKGRLPSCAARRSRT